MARRTTASPKAGKTDTNQTPLNPAERDAAVAAAKAQQAEENKAALAEMQEAQVAAGEDATGDVVAAVKQRRQREAQQRAEADARRMPDPLPAEFKMPTDRPPTLAELNMQAKIAHRGEVDEARAAARDVAVMVQDRMIGKRNRGRHSRFARTAAEMQALGQASEKTE